MSSEIIEEVFQDWENHYKDLDDLLFRKDKIELRNYITFYINQLMKLMILCNSAQEKDVETLSFEYFDTLKYVPPNVGERLQYVKQMRHLRNATIQLNELFKEMKKKYARAKAVGDIK